MKKQIHKMNPPANPYDVAAWNKFYAQNPGYHRSVGAEGNNDDGGDDDGGKGEENKITPEQYAALQKQNEELAAERDRLTAKNAEAEKHRKKQEAEAKAAIAEAARKNGDVEALEASWNEKYTTGITEREAAIEKLNATIHKITVGATATAMSADLALQGSSGVLKPHIEARLTMELKDDEPVVRVLGKDGKPSAMTLEDLKAEITNDSAFAPILKGSDASGGGKPGDKGADGKKTMKRGAFNGLSPNEQSTFIRSGGSVID